MNLRRGKNSPEGNSGRLLQLRQGSRDADGMLEDFQVAGVTPGMQSAEVA